MALVSLVARTAGHFLRRLNAPPLYRQSGHQINQRRFAFIPMYQPASAVIQFPSFNFYLATRQRIYSVNLVDFAPIESIRQLVHESGPYSFFSSNEDGSSELAALEPSVRGVALCITGSGLRVLNLLTVNPLRISCIDVNPAQTNLAEVDLPRV